VKLYEVLGEKMPKSIKIATLLYKPEAYKKSHKIDYVGKEIPNAFVLGYGLDYDGLGRNLSSIYVLKD
jgi:hypoxanthine phosphoribosyltransferase